KYSPTTSWVYDILVTGGEGEIQKLVSGIPKGIGWLNIVAIFDGDQRERLAGTKFNVPVLFLPGATDPDQMCKAEFQGADGPSLLSSALGITEDAAHVALAHASGTEYHDWVVELAKFLGIEINRVRQALVTGWLSREANDSLAKAFVAELE